jgi:hypothetical protein
MMGGTPICDPEGLHRRLIMLLTLCLLLVLALSACQPAGILPFAAPSSRVLFIGNSFTFYNAGIDQALRGLDRSVEVQRIATGGFTLMDHWGAGQATDAIRSQHWDYVVLQEQSQMPVIGVEQFSTYAANFSDEIRHAGAQPVLLMTWERPDSAQAGVTTAALAAAYYQVGNAVGARIAPAGEAFANALHERPDLSLYVQDGHPTTQGTYLAACVVYATLFGKSPVGLAYAPSAISRDEREFLQRIAAEAAGYGSRRR